MRGQVTYSCGKNGYLYLSRPGILGILAELLNEFKFLVLGYHSVTCTVWPSLRYRPRRPGSAVPRPGHGPSTGKPKRINARSTAYAAGGSGAAAAPMIILHRVSSLASCCLSSSGPSNATSSRTRSTKATASFWP